MKKKKEMYSNILDGSIRNFFVFLHEGEYTNTFSIRLSELALDDGSEWRRALLEYTGLDAVLDLPVGQSLLFPADRGKPEANARSAIVRIT